MMITDDTAITIKDKNENFIVQTRAAKRADGTWAFYIKARVTDQGDIYRFITNLKAIELALTPALPSKTKARVRGSEWTGLQENEVWSLLQKSREFFYSQREFIDTILFRDMEKSKWAKYPKQKRFVS